LEQRKRKRQQSIICGGKQPPQQGRKKSRAAARPAVLKIRKNITIPQQRKRGGDLRRKETEPNPPGRLDRSLGRSSRHTVQKRYELHRRTPCKARFNEKKRIPPRKKTDHFGWK